MALLIRMKHNAHSNIDRTITEYAKEIWDAKPCFIEP